MTFLRNYSHSLKRPKGRERQRVWPGRPGEIVQEQLEGSKEEVPDPGPGKGLARQLAEQNLTEWQSCGPLHRHVVT